MKLAAGPADLFSRVLCFSSTILIFAGVIASTGCGAGSSHSVPKVPGNTNVTVLLTSTGNDQLLQFDLELHKLTLTSQSGKTVTVLSAQQPSEFIHLNGDIEPLVTARIPQDTYTSASVTLARAQFVCVEQIPSGGLAFSNYSIVDQGPTVNLASPITVTGSNMALSLELLVSKSANFPACYNPVSFEGFSMAPTFSLGPPDARSTAVRALQGSVASIDTGGSLKLSVAAGPFGTRPLSVTANSATAFQGINGISALAPGMFVNADAALQPDGSLLATRIEVENPSTLNLSRGPILLVANLVPDLMLYGRTELGPLITESTGSGIYLDTPYFNFSNAVFQTSGQFTNLQTLPFVPSFNSSTMVAGQNVDVASGALSLGGPNYTPAETITLIPQTINGKIVGSSTSGNFTVYSVSLASYDLFPQLAVQPGQTTLLSNPSEFEVYVDSNTRKLNMTPLGVGNTLRFYGLVFNDNGTLRMDCGRVSDGVPE
jgi:hypothetical protein